MSSSLNWAMPWLEFLRSSSFFLMVWMDLRSEKSAYFDISSPSSSVFRSLLRVFL